MLKNIVLLPIKITLFILMHKGNGYSQIFLLYSGAIRLVRSVISSGSNMF